MPRRETLQLIKQRCLIQLKGFVASALWRREFMKSIDVLVAPTSISVSSFGFQLKFNEFFCGWKVVVAQR